MFLVGSEASRVQCQRFYPRSCVASLLDLQNSTSCHLLTASQPSHQPSDPAKLGVSSAPAGVPRPRCSLLAALYSDHQMTLPLWKLQRLLLPNPFDGNFVCAISRQKPNYSSHVPQGRFYELRLGLSRCSSTAGPVQGRGRNFEASNYLFSGGASDRKMSLGFYCLPDVMSWLYPISIVDILKSIKTCGFSGTFFLSKER